MGDDRPFVCNAPGCGQVCVFGSTPVHSLSIAEDSVFGVNSKRRGLPEMKMSSLLL